MNQNDQLKIIDSFSIIDLMGLKNLTDNQKDSLILDINNIVWSEFLQDRLKYVFTSEQIEIIYEKINSRKKIEEIIDLMESMSSNFGELLSEYTRIFKIAYVRKHHQTVVDNMDKILKKDDVSDKLKFVANREKSIRALECINEMLWSDILKIFYGEIDN